MSGSFRMDAYCQGWSRHSVLRWAAWPPLLFVGAMSFWTVALGFGGLSALSVTPDVVELGGLAPTVTEPMRGTAAAATIGPAAGGIVVNIEESAHPGVTGAPPRPPVA
jgi:hypothetical protein